MSQRLLKVALFSLVSSLLLLMITLPLIAMLYLSGIQYHSRWQVILFIFIIAAIDLIAECLGKIVVEGFTYLCSWNERISLIFRYILDFFLTLCITHYIDEWYPGVTLSTIGELTFSILILIFTAVLEMNTNDKKEA